MEATRELNYREFSSQAANFKRKIPHNGEGMQASNLDHLLTEWTSVMTRVFKLSLYWRREFLLGRIDIDKVPESDIRKCHDEVSAVGKLLRIRISSFKEQHGDILNCDQDFEDALEGFEQFSRGWKTPKKSGTPPMRGDVHLTPEQSEAFKAQLKRS